MIVLVRRRYFRLICISGLILGLWLIWQAGRIHLTQSSLRAVTVVIDPGHGGVDGGCGSGVWQEKRINLTIGLAVRDFLRQAGVRTVVTRTHDIALEADLRPGRHRRDLSRRVVLFKQANLFLSIHCDWSRDTGRSGPSVFYRYSRPDSKRLAENIQAEMNMLTGQKRRAEPGNYFILKNSPRPGVIAEAGFLSNPTDRTQLQDPAYLAALAASIGRGVLAYLRGQTAESMADPQQ